MTSSMIQHQLELIASINVNSFNEMQRKIFNKIFKDNEIFFFKGKIFLHDGS